MNRPSCFICNKNFKTEQALLRHNGSREHLMRAPYFQNPTQPVNNNLTENFQGVAQTYTLGLHSEEQTIEDYLYNNNDELLTRLNQHHGVKFSISIYYVLENVNDGAYQTAHIDSNIYIKQGYNDFRNLDKIFNDLYTKLEEDLELKFNSQWVFEKFHKICLNIDVIETFRGGSYIELPFVTKHIVNVRNFNSECFKYAITSAFYKPDYHQERPTFYEKFFINFNWTDISFPTSPSYVDIFEYHNSQLSVNIWSFNSNLHLYNLWESRNKENRLSINLLVLSNGQTCHYAYIKDLEALIQMQTISENKRGRNVFYLCPKCLCHSSNDKAFQKHMRICNDPLDVQYEMPKEGENILEFKTDHKMVRCPFVIYGDIEALLTTLNITPHQLEGLPATSDEKTILLNQHIPSSIYFRLHSDYPLLQQDVSRMFVGENSIIEFAKELYKYNDYFKNLLQTNIPYNLSDEEEAEFQNATYCKHCKGAFDESTRFDNQITHECNYCQNFISKKSARKCDKCKIYLGELKKLELNDKSKHRHHDHYSGKYIGALHGSCNLKLRVPNFIPVIFHNLSGYDGHHVIREIAAIFKDEKIKVIPKTDELYISFRVGVYKFIDSCRFFPPPSSLDAIAESLIERDKDKKMIPEKTKLNFPKLVKEFGDKWYHMVNKGIYPYEYMSTWESYNEQLPSKEAFHSKLNNKDISDEEYIRAQQVWTAFNCQNMGEYTLLYLKQDVCLLEDCFEYFRQQFDLDPCHYVSTPGLTWERGLQFCKQPLELLTDLNMYKSYMKGMRGGVSTVYGSRITYATNKDVLRLNPKAYNKGKEFKQQHGITLRNNYLFHVDATNLYGDSMSQHLPIGNFYQEDVTQELYDIILNTLDDSTTGYTLEVDLKYTQVCKNKTFRFPLAPEHVIPDFEKLLPYQQFIGKRMKVKKLCCTLNDKNNYMIDYRNLKYYISLGMEVTAVHQIISYTQLPWLKTYIDLNTKKRNEGLTPFEKNIWKLMNNAYFGKTMENVGRYKDIELINNLSQYIRATSKATFKTRTIFSEDLVAVHKYKNKVTCNKPIYLGFCILELSKLRMYRNFYDHILPIYGTNNVEVLYGDTDSFFLNIFTDDLYKDLEDPRWMKVMDYQKYPKEGKLFKCNENFDKLGKLKDEGESKIMYRAAFLRSKCYAVEGFNLKGEIQVHGKKIKGIQKGVVKKMKFEQFESIILNSAELFRKFLSNYQFQNEQEMQQEISGVSNYQQVVSFNSHGHNIYTQEVKKKALSAYDDKVLIADNGITTYPHGYFY